MVFLSYGADFNRDTCGSGAWASKPQIYERDYRKWGQRESRAADAARRVDVDGSEL